MTTNEAAALTAKPRDQIQKLLIVDDSGMARMIIRQCFEIAGFRGRTFVEASNGRDALEKIDGVDMVVTDLNMPVMEGTALLAEIRKMTSFANVPVIIITSTSNPAKEAELIKSGAFAVINKPISPASVHQALSNLK